MPQPNDPQQDFTRMVRFLILTMIIFLGWKYFFDKPQPVQPQTQQAQTTAPVAGAPKQEIKPRADVIAATKRVPIAADKLTGSINLTGARIDDLSLVGYYTSVGVQANKLNKTSSLKEFANDNGYVELLSPSDTVQAYYVEDGWTSEDSAVVVPDSKTVWTLAPGSDTTLKSGSSVKLQWDNGHGLIFTRTISLDQNYLFTVTQTVENKTAAAVKLNAWHLISRHNIPADFRGTYVLHEGPLADLNHKLKEVSYKDLAKGDKVEEDGVQGWVGISDKYWFVGLYSDPEEKFNARIIGNKNGNDQAYQADVVDDTQTVAPGQTVTDKKYVFAGVKKLPLVEAYSDQYHFWKPELMFDFGLFSIITEPFFKLLHFLMNTIGNVGLAILCMTVIIRGAMFPLANKSFRSMAGMKKIAPQLKELQAKYADNREKLQMEIFQLYKKENVNPFSGCWPMLIQIPIFFALYKSILLSVELRHAPFWGWIHDLSAPDPTNLFNLFGLIPWTPPAALAIGAWPCLFCITMIIQRRLSPPMPDKAQETLQNYFPFIITIMLAKFAAGLVIYWTWSNILGILQQYYIINKTSAQKVSLLRGHSERQKKKK